MRERLSPILAPYRGQRGTLIPVLQKVQEEVGYLPEEAISEIAHFLGISKSEVYGSSCTTTGGSTYKNARLLTVLQSLPF